MTETPSRLVALMDFENLLMLLAAAAAALVMAIISSVG